MKPIIRTACLLLAVLFLLPSCEFVETRTPTEQAARFWPREQWDDAACVIYHESRGDPNAGNDYRGGHYGILQIGKRTWQREFEEFTGKPFFPGVFDPRLSGAFAYHRIYAEGGWRPWSVRRLCGL